MPFASNFMISFKLQLLLLSKYQIKILPSSCNIKNKNKNYDNNNSYNLNDIIKFEANGINDINYKFGENNSDSGNGNYTNNNNNEKIEVDMNGREIIIYFPPAALNSLPTEYQKGAHNGGAILRIVAVLFSQVSCIKY